MQDILEFINSRTDNKYKDLLFFGAKFSKNSRTVELLFRHAPDIKYSKEDKEELLKLSAEYIGIDIEVKLTVKKQSRSEEYCQKLIKDYISSKANLTGIVDIANIEVKEKDDVMYCSIPLSSALIKEEQRCVIEENIEGLLRAEGIENFQFEYPAFEVDFSDILKERQDMVYAETVQMNKKQTIHILKQTSLFGNISGITEALPISEIKGEEKGIYVAGNISNIVKRTFRKKDAESDSEFYNFTLTFQEFSVNCVTFSAQANTLDDVKDGKEVLVLCDPDNFNGQMSLKVKALSLCEINFVERTERKVNDRYITIKPEPYLIKQQANFLLSDNSITSKYLLNNTFVVFDFETTGLKYDVCKIIEIGAVKIVEGKITEQFSTFINPEIPIPADASAVNGIYDNMVKDAPTIEQVMPDFFKFCYGSIIVAHNIEFDYGFLNYYGKKSQFNFNNKREDTMMRAKMYLKGIKNYKLKTVCEALNIVLTGAHRAVNDTIATAKVFIKLMENYVQ